MKEQTTKQWLYSVRAIERRKRMIVQKVESIRADHETIFDAATALYGEPYYDGKKSANAEIIRAPYQTSDPTLNKAITLCDRMTVRLGELLSEYEKLTLESDMIRDELNRCFEKGVMKVEEYEAIFHFFFDGLSNVEVAEIMYYSVDYVSQLKCEGLKKITEFKLSQEIPN